MQFPQQKMMNVVLSVYKHTEGNLVSVRVYRIDASICSFLATTQCFLHWFCYFSFLMFVHEISYSCYHCYVAAFRLGSALLIHTLALQLVLNDTAIMMNSANRGRVSCDLSDSARSVSRHQ